MHSQLVFPVGHMQPQLWLIRLSSGPVLHCAVSLGPQAAASLSIETNSTRKSSPHCVYTYICNILITFSSSTCWSRFNWAVCIAIVGNSQHQVLQRCTATSHRLPQRRSIPPLWPSDLALFSSSAVQSSLARFLLHQALMKWHQEILLEVPPAALHFHDPLQWLWVQTTKTQ